MTTIKAAARCIFVLICLQRLFLHQQRLYALAFLTATTSHCKQKTKVLCFATTSLADVQKQRPDNVKILILPGFGNDSKDYVLSKAPQGSLVTSLIKRGWSKDQIHVLPVQRTDWLQVFWKGFLDPLFWRGNMPPTRPAYTWYLQRVAQHVQELTTTTIDGKNQETKSKQINANSQGDDDIRVIIIGHSAGGWLARAALGYGSLQTDQTNESNDVINNNDDNNVTTEPASWKIDLSKIAGLVTLGAPHLPPPPTVMDMTRGALKLTHTTFPHSYHKSMLFFYITVVGDALQGVQQVKQLPWEPTTATGFAYSAYQAVCGDGNMRGDGVVPLCAAHLDDAVQLNLAGVFHSINIPEKWYGSDSQIDSWHAVMIEQLNKQLSTTLSAENSQSRV